MLKNLFGFDESDSDNPAGLTKTTRQRPNGRLTGVDAEETEFGVDRDGSGQFASKRRDPVPLLRDDDTGQYEADPFAVGNFGASVGEDKRR